MQLPSFTSGFAFIRKEGSPTRRTLYLLLFGCCVGCIHPNVAVKPNYDFTKVQRVALIRFEDFPKMSGSGEIVTRLFEQSLIQSHYQLIERAEVERILKEQAFDLTGAVDPSTAKQVGHLLGVDALVLGDVTDYRPEKKNTYLVAVEEVSQQPIIRRKLEKVKQGKDWVTVEKQIIDGYTTNKKRYTVPQTEYIDARVGLSVRMVDIETSEVIWSASYAIESSDTSTAAELVSKHILKSVSQKIFEQSKQNH